MLYMYTALLHANKRRIHTARRFPKAVNSIHNGKFLAIRNDRTYTKSPFFDPMTMMDYHFISHFISITDITEQIG